MQPVNMFVDEKYWASLFFICSEEKYITWLQRIFKADM